MVMRMRMIGMDDEVESVNHNSKPKIIGRRWGFEKSAFKKKIWQTQHEISRFCFPFRSFDLCILLL